MLSGTLLHQCRDGQCHCHRRTGACPCREHVEGYNCDQCAANHWNYGQAGGCEPCGCDPDHSTSAHCNMVTRWRPFGFKCNPRRSSMLVLWSLPVLCSSPASATATLALVGSGAPSVSSFTGETPKCSAKVPTCCRISASSFSSSQPNVFSF